MLAGNILGKTKTISVAIASETAVGDYETAGIWVVVIIIISFGVMIVSNLFSKRIGKFRGRW